MILLIAIGKLRRFTCIVVSLTYDSTKRLSLTDLFVYYCVYSIFAVVDPPSISDVDLREIFRYEFLNCPPRSILVPGYTMQALYEVYGQTI